MPHVESYVDGIWFPSVSTIIGAEPKPWLQAWKNKWGTRAERKTAIANAIGTTFHDCIEQYLDRGYWAANIPDYPSCEKRINGMMKSWVTWADSVDGDVLVTELRVISRIYKYSGTLDCIMEIRNV